MKNTEDANGGSIHRAGSAARTGNKRIDEFLADYDRRISDADKTTPESSKENLRRMRPAVLILAQNEPEKCELFINRWIAANLPPNARLEQSAGEK